MYMHQFMFYIYQTRIYLFSQVGENFKVSNKGLGPVITIDGSLLSTEAKGHMYILIYM